MQFDRTKGTYCKALFINEFLSIKILQFKIYVVGKKKRIFEVFFFFYLIIG